MQVEVEKLSPVLLQLAVQVEAERVRDELDKAYRQVGKTAKIRGFRPGKAPRNVLAHMYGPRVERDVAQRLIDETYDKAIKEQDVQTVSQPSIEPDPIKRNAPFSYKARVEIVPVIEKVEFEGLTAKRPSTEVTDEALAEELAGLQRANSTLEPPAKKRKAKKGDVVTIDFVVEVDGEQVEGAGTTGFDTELGGGQLLGDIESALIGLKPGEQADAEVQMPDQHPSPALRGKKATFKLTLQELKERVLPELDDDFAKDLGDYDNLEALKTSLKETIAKRLTEEAEAAVAEELVKQLVEKNPIDVPPALVRQQLQASERELLQQARAAGQQARSLPAEMRAELQRDSEMKVRAGLLMAQIAKSEGFKIGDKELEEGMKELAEQTGKNIAKVKAEYRDPKKREMLIGMILENKVLDIIQSKAKIEDS